MVEANELSAGLDCRQWRERSWQALGAFPPWPNHAESVLLAAMAIHYVFAMLIRPLFRHQVPKDFRDRLISTASATVALWAVVHAPRSPALSFGRGLPWAIALAHVLHVYREVQAAKPSRSVLDAVASTAFLLVLECMHYGQEKKFSGDTLVSVFSVWLSALLLVIFLSTPRGNSEFHDGLLVDRQHTASYLEVLTFLWPRKVFRLKVLSQEDIDTLPTLSANCRTALLVERHRRIARKLASHKLVFVLAREYIKPLMFQCCLAIIHALSLLGPNLVTYHLLQHLSGGSVGSSRDSLSLAFLLGFSKALPALLGAWMDWVGSSMIYLPMRSTLSALVYQKILSLPTVAVSVDGRGLQSNETWLQASALSIRACHWISTCGVVVGLLTQSGCTAAVIITLVGWKSVAIAIAAALLTAPLTTAIMNRWTTLLIRNWGLGRDRNAILQRAFLAIRHIKLSATEDFWKQKIYQIRQEELQGYTKIAWLLFWKGIIENISPAILSGIPIYIYAWQGHSLTPSVAFTFVNLFKELQSKLWDIPQKLPPLQAGWISASELDMFLKQSEIYEPQFISSDTLSLHNATITRYGTASEEEQFRLENVNAAFPTGELSIISGKTGCGKTLLLSALAGEAKISSGHIGRPFASKTEYSEKELDKNWVQPDTCAIVSQNPWMDNSTIQDNILFGLPLDEERYARVLYCCALDVDLLRFKDGDMTVVSIKGVSLSGGQRSRIALARALYSRASFLLMDDVLSAVDTEVREWIVEKALCGNLARGRTRILVTHHEKQLASKISYRLRIHDQTATGERLSSNAPSSTEKDSGKSSSADDGFDYALYCRKRGNSSVQVTPQAAKPSTTELSLRMAPYIMYFKTSGGAASWLFAFVSLILCEWNRLSTSSRFEDWVSGKEAGAASSSSPSPAQAYMVMSALTTLTMSMRGVVMFRIYRIASQKLFCQMTERIFGAPLQWLESTTRGGIFQRYDRSMRNVDEDVTYAISGFLVLVSQLITFLWRSTSFSLYETPLVIVLLYIIFIVARDLIPAAEYLINIDSATWSVILQHRSSLYAPDGISTVRVYGMKDRFFQRASLMFDKSASATWYSVLHGVATKFQLGFLGAIYVSLTCYTIAVSGMGAGAAGTALSFAVQLSETVTSCVQRICAMDSGLMAAEKVNEYGSIQQEPSDGTDVRHSWPEKGQIQFCNYRAGYGPGLPDTLRNVNFIIRPGERVGVVGRTGAGKSTLALSLARLVERRAGVIYIDLFDISRIKLEVLRKRILILPQDPYLCGGTLRSILDPSGAHSDRELLASLTQFRLLPATAGAETKSVAGDSDLLFMVSEGGANLSQGQRQIVCLVKAILSRKKIVVMDEATSAVDLETDSAIQTAIREGLQDTTVVIIAHRLATVINLDKVLVMDDGKVVEFGKPADLYQKEGLFSSLINHSINREDLVKTLRIE